jgi:hypothetical protein
MHSIAQPHFELSRAFSVEPLWNLRMCWLMVVSRSNLRPIICYLITDAIIPIAFWVYVLQFPLKNRLIRWMRSCDLSSQKFRVKSNHMTQLILTSFSRFDLAILAHSSRQPFNSLKTIQSLSMRCSNVTIFDRRQLPGGHAGQKMLSVNTISVRNSVSVHP